MVKTYTDTLKFGNPDETRKNSSRKGKSTGTRADGHWICVRSNCTVNLTLTFTHLCAVSADDRHANFLVFPESRIWYLLRVASLGDNLHEVQGPVFGEE